MNLLLELTLRGSAAAILVWLLDRAFAGRISGSSRRWWWALVPVAFLIPLHLPLLAAMGRLPAPGFLGLAPPLDFPLGGTAAPGAAVGRRHVVELIWLAGGLGYLAVVAIQTIRASRRWSRETLSTHPALLALLESCKAEAGVAAPVGLVVSSSVSSPAIMGWWRPRILLPEALARSAPADLLRPVFLHELAHLRWYDVPFGWLLAVVRAVHWFNPLAHLGALSWARFREEAADEAAMRWMAGDASLLYGEALVRSLRQTCAGALPFGSYGIAESVRDLKRRITMINHYHDKSPRGLLTAAVTLLLTAAVCSLPARAADLTDTDPKANVAASAAMWLKHLDEGKFDLTYTEGGAWLHGLESGQQWEGAMVQERAKYGRGLEHELKSLRFENTPSGKFAGEWAYVEFDATHEKNPRMTETVVFKKEADGAWKVAGYSIGDRKP
jgi:beta-lactamase regulating signal transducer with metallopeptidase domain